MLSNKLCYVDYVEMPNRILLMKQMLALLVFSWSLSTLALETKHISAIDLKELIKETQLHFTSNDGQHSALVWWIPYEYWAVLIEQNQGLTRTAKIEMQDVLKDYFIVAALQADLSLTGSFTFYSKPEVLNRMIVSYQPFQHKSQRSLPLEKLPPIMDLMMSDVTPSLKKTMGSMGESFHFFVFSDTGEGDTRFADPYSKGVFRVRLGLRDHSNIEMEVFTPLNVLYEARMCPSGKPAHISWSFCPWSGEAL